MTLLPYRPRWLNRIYANRRGYFWLPCARCDRMFGGHECGENVVNPEDFRDGPPNSYSGWMLCRGCSGGRTGDVMDAALFHKAESRREQA